MGPAVDGPSREALHDDASERLRCLDQEDFMDGTVIDPYLQPDSAEELRKQVALFRYGLIADLVHLPDGQRGLYKRLAEKAAQEHAIPGTLRRRVAAETMRGWLADYRRGGFDALIPKPRADAGGTRSIRSRGRGPLVSCERRAS
jgi:hypothetical protein